MQPSSHPDGERYLITRAELNALVGRIHALEDALRDECLSRQSSKSIPQSGILLDDQQPEGDFARQASGRADNPSNIRSRAPMPEQAVPHSLLRPELLEIKDGIKFNVIGEEKSGFREWSEEPDSQLLSEMMGTFGTLSVEDGQATRFLGASAVEVRVVSENFPLF